MSRLSIQENDSNIEIRENKDNTETLFIPSILYGKSQEDLKDVLNDSLLLDTILNMTYPRILKQTNALIDAHKTNIQFSEELLNQKSYLLDLQKSAKDIINEMKKYEKEWEDSKENMNNSLQPFSKSYLLFKLQNAIDEINNFSYSLQKSFIENKEDTNLLTFIKEYRQARKLYYNRLEKKKIMEI
ncbi:hypothetical protein T552_03403 [Pneumocystis carinii B80]|uniref:VPS37 C-terminal domain-containing protein n=1 Tax=Pneumocystis carinii (strain B80) TaxID=1408658 RepID=A0A0W4ZBW4_PNEC8|nr:hypothetical protein T552_03403 [Pneumocystis carinii B80]KTW25790.1 hypothetical protein T552_03403 [Pneumocystis carinii B80]